MSEPETLKSLFPIHNRINYVGGIESITIDEIRYYFGYDYKINLVISPLISDMDIMAAFASKFMEQTDGRHEPSYWRELVEASIDESGISSREGSRDFSSEQMKRIAIELRLAQTVNIPITGFYIEYHMLDLLCAACDDTLDPSEDESVALALSRLQIDPETLDWDCYIEVAAIMNRDQELPTGGSYADVAFVIMEYLRSYVNNAPNNWNALFSPLISN